MQETTNSVQAGILFAGTLSAIGLLLYGMKKISDQAHIDKKEHPESWTEWLQRGNQTTPQADPEPSQAETLFRRKQMEGDWQFKPMTRQTYEFGAYRDVAHKYDMVYDNDRCGLWYRRK